MTPFQLLPRRISFISEKRGFAAPWLLTLAVCLVALPGMARRWYVAPFTAGTGDAYSWGNATNNLTGALDNANSGDEIWIKAGTYRRYDQHSFQIKSGVKVYGGFYGNEVNLSDRNANLSANGVTITNSPTASGTNSTNYDQPVFQVISADNTSLLDRVYITNAFTSASYGPYPGVGAAIYMSNSSIVINNVTFSGGTAEYKGGAIWMTNSAPTFTGCTFSNNKSNREAGGAVWAENSSRPIFKNTSFYGNATVENPTAGGDAVGKGGAIYMRGGKLTLDTDSFNNNQASSDGGAVYLENSTENSSFSKVIFEINKSGYRNSAFSTSGNGGAIYNYKSSYNFVNGVLYNNRTGGNGGAIFNYLGADANIVPRLTNVFFNSNGTYTGTGGAIGNDRSSPVVTNCTFIYNYCGSTQGAGGIYSFSSNPTSFGENPKPVVVNSVFTKNGYTSGGAISTLADIAQTSSATTTVTYSVFKETSTFSGTGNIASTAVLTPFINENSPKGADGIWLTADDGFHPSFCSRTLIDKGNNDAIDAAVTTDLGNQNRRNNVKLVVDSGNASGQTATVDIGAYESQDTASTATLAGTIGLRLISGNTITISDTKPIPNPQELSPDSVINQISPAVNTSISWQKKEGTGGNWVTATPAGSSQIYILPALTTTTLYRRVAVASDYCNLQVNSNEVTLKVINPNGSITGQVTSNTNAPVPGITIRATRKVAVPGGPVRYVYTTTTGNDGRYTLSSIYYGDPDAASKDSFSVSAVQPGHTFDFDSIPVQLTSSAPQTANFKDLTVFTVRGQTKQGCSNCPVSNLTCPLDSVELRKTSSNNFNSSTRSGYIDGNYGQYSIALADLSQVVIKPVFYNHRFQPDSVKFTPTGNMTGVDFTDTTTHLLTGKISAGCNEVIGSATLEFADVLPNGPNGEVRNSCFRTRVMTSTSGAFTVRLPARKYKVQVVTFSANNLTNPITNSDVVSFINALPPDSLTRDITLRDTTLNLVYVRKPTISITGGFNNVCQGTPSFAVLPQLTADSTKVLVYQGPASLNCPLSDTTNKITIRTNIQMEDQFETISLPVRDTGTKVRLIGGIPLIDSTNYPYGYLKSLYIYFTDKYGRTADSFNRRVLVTGVKSDPGTFTTVSPEVPLLVLHDPPGDGSSSTWQETQSISNAVRMYMQVGGSVEAWVEAKLGFKVLVGIGAAVETEVWGKVKENITVNASATAGNETILTTTTSNAFSTSNNPAVTGSGGDVYIGAALNLKYAIATNVKYSNCGITKNRQLVMANDGFATKYIYSEDFITNTLIPNLQILAQVKPDSAAFFLNQMKVWQQAVANNTENKRNAPFVQNYSFNGGGQSFTSTTTTTSSKSSSLEFSLGLDAGIALELGAEEAGSGASAGLNVNVRLETGRSETNTATNETTIGYTLADGTPGDYFSVNVKKDPVYNTPVFELAAGTSSCPTEPGTQPRDAVTILPNTPVQQNVPANLPANFNLIVTNTSPSSNGTGETRTYYVNYVPSSNIANETITIAGSPYSASSPYNTGPLAYGQSVTIPVSITRQTGSSIYSYENERFTVANTCGEDLGKTVAISAYFASPCSSINLAQPGDGWVVSAASNNTVFVKADGYTLANLTSVEIQYALNNGNTWVSAQTLTATQLANGFNFDVSTLPEGPVSLRLRLNCNSGVVYSQRATGIIDRRAPQLFGRPTPTDNNYVNGETISFTYNEKLNTNASLQVIIRRLSNNTLIPATASLYENKVIIVPGTSLAAFTGDTIRVILSGVSDVYGNVKTVPDTTGFVVGTSVVATGNQALFVGITNPRVYKNNDTGAIKITFTLPAPVPANGNVRVNYTIGGTARYGIDYTASYTSSDALYASFNGSTGSIRIPPLSQTATLTLRPITGDTSYSPDKTIIISAVDGGDYGLSATTSVTGVLTSDDGINTYTFTGDGNWSIASNWLNGKKPLSTLVAPKEIIIDPAGTCILNIPQTIRTGAKVTVKANRRFIIQGNLKLN